MQRMISQACRKKNKNLIMDGLGVMIILCITGWFLRYNKGICIVGDEFGYWMNASLLCGYDWSDAAADISYYGWGYSLILTPLMMLFHSNVTLMYQAGLLMNSVMLCAVYFLVIKVEDRLASEKLSDQVKKVIALASVLYPDYILCSQEIFVDAALCLLMWAVIYLVMEALERKDIRRWIAAGGASIYAYAVHQRAVVMIIAVILIYIAANCAGGHSGKRRKKGEIFLFFAAVCLAFIAAALIKKVYVFYAYSSTPPAKVAVNDFGHQIDRLHMFFSADGMKGLAVSVLGKLFYINAVTCGLGFFGLAFWVTKIKEIKCRDDFMKKGIFVFLMLVFIGIILVAAYFTAFWGNRPDTIVYGRYVDYIAGALIVSGAVYLFGERRRSVWLPWLTVSLLLCLVTALNIDKEGYIGVFNVSGMADLFFAENVSPPKAVAFAYFRSLIPPLVYMGIRNRKNYYIYLLCILSLWIGGFFHVYQNEVLPWRMELEENNDFREIALEKIEEGYELVSYECLERTMYIQFLMPEYSIKNIYDINEIGRDYIVLTDRRHYEEIKGNRILLKNNLFVLWEKEED